MRSSKTSKTVRARNQPRAKARKAPRNEPVADLHSPAHRHFFAYGRYPARGPGGVPAIAGVGVAGGGLPDHSGGHLLSRRKPRRDGVVGDGAARKAIRPGPGP